jgi:hypothetical protein
MQSSDKRPSNTLCNYFYKLDHISIECKFRKKITRQMLFGFLNQNSNDLFIYPHISIRHILRESLINIDTYLC